MYKDKQGGSHFLLDEYLNWIPYKRTTPSLSFHGDLGKWCGNKPLDSGVENHELSFDLFQTQIGSQGRGDLPAIHVPHAGRPWVKVLRNMTSI